MGRTPDRGGEEEQGICVKRRCPAHFPDSVSAHLSAGACLGSAGRQRDAAPDNSGAARRCGDIWVRGGRDLVCVVALRRFAAHRVHLRAEHLRGRRAHGRRPRPHDARRLRRAGPPHRVPAGQHAGRRHLHRPPRRQQHHRRAQRPQAVPPQSHSFRVRPICLARLPLRRVGPVAGHRLRQRAAVCVRRPQAATAAGPRPARAPFSGRGGARAAQAALPRWPRTRTWGTCSRPDRYPVPAPFPAQFGRHSPPWPPTRRLRPPR